MAGARLMKLKTWSIYSQQIAHKASYTPRSGPFPKCRASLASRTRVIRLGGFSSYTGSSILSISFLIVGQTFWSLTHSPLWGPWSSLQWMTQWSERCVLPTCASCRETTRGECSRFCAKQHNCSREYTSVRTGGVPAHSKDLIYNVIVGYSSRLRITSAWSEPLEDTAWTTPSRMSSASPKSDDVTLITILSTVTVEIILNLLHLLSIKMKT
jgi:hypothetical protein